MTPTDANPPLTDHFKDVLRVCHRVAILDGEMETSLFKTLESYLLDEMPVNADRPHTQKSTVQQDCFEAWDFITTGENHAHNARVRTRRRVGVYADVPLRENGPKSLETKVRSSLEDDERDGVMNSDMKPDDNHWNTTRVPYKVISDVETTNIEEGRHHHTQVPAAPTGDGKLDRPEDMVPRAPDETSASNAPPDARMTELTPETDMSTDITRTTNSDVKNPDAATEMDMVPPDETSASSVFTPR
ncbi:Hypp2195 [Branchiostoma lanceolatum]|uniref:Hypp2195 protein n=1 Tax=Branchiostoma lanceolatum TaxID=7740 RepID=A0A8J9ZRT3_BRALA|nr:Hypp2195 [Branchiostoma lanceolatum]